jgi:hypothetical protein
VGIQNIKVKIGGKAGGLIIPTTHANWCYLKKPTQRSGNGCAVTEHTTLIPKCRRHGTRYALDDIYALINKMYHYIFDQLQTQAGAIVNIGGSLLYFLVTSFIDLVDL